MNETLQDVVLTSPGGGAALKALYDLKKAASPRFSLGVLCRAAGITSKGYLSDVMTGRRQLNLKYAPALGKSFGFEGAWLEAFTLLFDPTQEARLTALRKSLKKSAEVLPRKLRGMFFAFEVFCAFGLFKNQPTRAELRGYFGAGRGIELEYALQVLASMALIRSEGDGFVLLAENIRFSESEDGISHLEFLRMAVQDAHEQVAGWYGRREEAFFDANILSVKREDYLKALPRLKETIRQLLVGLESGDADLLVRFNTQIYPTKS